MEPRDIDVPAGEVLTWLAGLVAGGRMLEATKCAGGDVEYVIGSGEDGVVIVTLPGKMMLEFLAGRQQHDGGNGYGLAGG